MPNVAQILVLLFVSSINGGGSIGVSWTVPQTNEGGALIMAPLTYNLWRSHDGGGYQKIRSSVKDTQITVIGDLVKGAKECFQVSVIEDGVESDLTTPNCITLP